MRITYMLSNECVGRLADLCWEDFTLISELRSLLLQGKFNFSVLSMVVLSMLDWKDVGVMLCFLNNLILNWLNVCLLKVSACSITRKHKSVVKDLLDGDVGEPHDLEQL